VLPIKCCQSSCNSSFASINNLIRHLNNFHKCEVDLADDLASRPTVEHGTVEHSAGNDGSESDMDVDESYAERRAGEDELNVEEIHSEGVALIARLRAKGNIPYNIISDVVSSFNSMASSIVSHVQSVVTRSLVSSGVGENAVKCVESDIKQHTSNVPLNFLSSTYKQDKYFDNHPLAVKPESVVHGSRFETSDGISKTRYDTFEYVSIEQNLRTLLMNKSYVRALLEDKCKPGIMCDFVDGQRCKNHYLFSDNTKLTIILQLFYDGLGTTNPLRGQSTICNVGVFFYVVKNLPAAFNSCFANVHLLALCYSADLKSYGFNPILAKVIAEIRHLSTEGLRGDFPLIGSRPVYVSIGQVTCDNLALNGLFGFIESFAVDNFCTLCLCTMDDIQEKFFEHQFKKRTLDEYNKDINNLPQAFASGKLHSRGIKSECLLNEIDGFHVTVNYGLDPFHIILEGIALVELGCILYTLCITKRYFSIETLNRRVDRFWSVINTEKRNKPPQLYSPEEGCRIKPSMKAVQCWALIKYLPIIVGDLVPDNDQHWLFLLDLCHLVDLVFAPMFTEGMIDYLRYIIADHLEQMKMLYGSVTTLKPKHHLMVHFPTIIKQCGPLVGMSCMRYELKNAFFKRCAHSMYNFRNVCKTLAYRHQQYSLYAKLSCENVRDVIIPIDSSAVPVCSLPCCDALVSCLNIETTDDIFVSTKVDRASVRYSTGHHVIVDISEDNGLPEFGCIDSFVCTPSGEIWYLVVRLLRTVAFIPHYHSYLVDPLDSNKYAVLQLKDLIDHRVVCAFRKRGYLYLRMPYYVIKP
jgi:hypothetical protein